MKKKKSDVLLGRRHEWTDTQGMAHCVVFDEPTPVKTRATWIALLCVTAIASLIGATIIATSDKSRSEPAFVGTVSDVPKFAFERKIIGSEGVPPTLIAAGWGTELFLAGRNGIELYDASGEKLDSWKNDEELEPTALTFVSDEKSAHNGLLLIGYPEKIKAIQFSLEQYSTETPAEVGDASTDEDEESIKPSPKRTARNGALNEAETVLLCSGVDVRGLACSAERLFVADYRAQRIRRYSLMKLMARTNVEKNVAPDCELGAPDEERSYPGVKPAFERNFCLSYLKETNAIYVANSGLFRIDAFDAGSGGWRSELSWINAPGGARAFVGAANPIAFAVAPRWFATVETGLADAENPDNRSTPLQLFNAEGQWLAEVASYDGGESDGISPLAIDSSSDFHYLYVLKSNGELVVLSDLQ